MDDILADLAHEPETGLDGCVAAARALDHFAERNDVGRVPEMQADGPLGVLIGQAFGDDADRDHRGIGGQNGFRSGRSGQIGEDRLLQCRLLGCRFDHQIGALYGGCHLLRQEQAGELLPQPVERGAIGIEDGDLPARLGKQPGQAAAHQSRADQPDFHAVSPAMLRFELLESYSYSSLLLKDGGCIRFVQ